MSHLESAVFSDTCNYYQTFELLNMVNDALVLINAHNRKILFMNQKALKMYKYTQEEAFVLSLEQISCHSVALICENMDLAKRYKHGYIFKDNHIKKDDSIFPVEICARYLTIHGEELLVLMVGNSTPYSRMQEEVEMAGKVQRRLLPRDVENDLFSIHSIYKPHNYVSGDLYDFNFENEKNILYGIMIDVMGHGIVATAQMGILKYLFMQAKEKDIPVNEKLRWINKESMSFFKDSGFAGIFLFEFDFTRNVLTYSAGGINHFIVIKAQGTEIVKMPGLFVGINEDEVFDQGVLHFQSGESFLFLTDGLFDLLPRPMDNTLDFLEIQELCKALLANGNHHDDASSVGVVIR